MIVCELCKTVIIGETTVGDLIKEGDVLRKEGMRNDETKLMQAMGKYHAVWNALNKSHGNHAECVRAIDKEYEAVYRIIQGSRA